MRDGATGRGPLGDLRDHSAQPQPPPRRQLGPIEPARRDVLARASGVDGMPLGLQGQDELDRVQAQGRWGAP